MRFRVQIPMRCDIIQQIIRTLPQHTLVYIYMCTDELRTNEGNEAGISGPRSHINIALSKSPTVFQTINA